MKDIAILKILKTVDESKIEISLIDYMHQNIEQVIDIKLIQKAMDTAIHYHKGQFRKSGEPYVTHPIMVATIVMEYMFKTDVIIAALLHDTVEDTILTVEDIEKEFGQRIAEIVDRLTRDRLNGSKLTVEEILDNAYENKDKKVLLIKLIDRLHNIQTISSMLISKQKKITTQTINEFLILCQYLELPEVLYDLFNKSIIEPISSFSLQKERNFFSKCFQPMHLTFENEKYPDHMQ